MMVKISTIIYVHNSESFLAESLESLLNQSFKDFEVIIIENSVNENINSKINKYFENLKISILSTEDLGFNKSVNQAIKQAQGKYIHIMSPATILEENAYKLLFEKSEKNNVDLIISDSNYRANNDEKIVKHDKFTQTLEYEKEVFDVKNIQELFNIDLSLDNKLFNSTFLNEKNIIFSNEIKNDYRIFFYESLLSAKKITNLNESVITHKDYVSNISNRNDSNLLDFIAITNQIITLFEKNNLLENVKQDIYERKMNLIMYGYNKIREEYKEAYFNNLREDFINILENKELCDEFIENISDYNHKIFEQVIISENFYEFKLLRNSLDEMKEFNNILDERQYLKTVVQKSEKI